MERLDYFGRKHLSKWQNNLRPHTFARSNTLRCLPLLRDKTCAPQKSLKQSLYFFGRQPRFGLRRNRNMRWKASKRRRRRRRRRRLKRERGEGQEAERGDKQINQSREGARTPPPPVPSFPPKGETSRFDSFWPPASFCVGGDPAGHGVFLYFIVFLLGTWKLSRLLLEICKKSAKRKALLLWQMTEVRWVGDAVRYERLETPRLFSRKKIGDR